MDTIISRSDFYHGCNKHTHGVTNVEKFICLGCHVLCWFMLLFGLWC